MSTALGPVLCDMDTRMSTAINTLHDLYNSRAYQAFEADKLGNNLFLTDPERANRIHEAAERGSDGSTHAEHIEDWREFLKTLKVIDPEWPDDGGDITQEAYDAIEAEIDDCWAWHEKNGSLEQQCS